MLEFIVLGHIPGTNIYLSFTDVALFIVGLSLVISTYAIIRSMVRIQLKKIKSKQALIFSRTI